MKNKMIISVIAVFLLLVSIGGGFCMFKQKEKEAKVIEWERAVAKQIKNIFVDIEEIHFSKEYADNYWLAGFIGVSCSVKTTNNETTKLFLDLPINDKEDMKKEFISEAEQNLEDGKIIEGETNSTIIVSYSDGSEEEI